MNEVHILDNDAAVMAQIRRIVGETGGGVTIHAADGRLVALEAHGGDQAFVWIGDIPDPVIDWESEIEAILSTV